MGSAPGPGHIGGSLQIINSPGGCGVFTSPTVWTDPKGRVLVLYADNCGMSAYVVRTSAGSRPSLAVLWRLHGSHYDTPVLAGKLLYVAQPSGVGVFNPETGHRMWTSQSLPKVQSIGYIHWEYPAVSGSMIFMTDENARLYAYARS
jgi:hypothetical protein